jgi:hypothetical protein
MFNPLTLALLVSRVGTNDPYHALAPHHFAVAAQLFYRCPDFHNDLQTGNALATDKFSYCIDLRVSAFICGRK